MIEDMLTRLLALEKHVYKLEASDAKTIAARYMTDTAQTIPASTYTIVNFDTVDFDELLLVTTGASWKFTAPVGGYYQINVFVEITFASAITTGKTFYTAIYIDGSPKSIIAHWHQLTSSVNSDAHMNGSELVYLAKDSYVDVRVWHNMTSSGTLETNEVENHVSVHLIDRTL